MGVETGELLSTEQGLRGCCGDEIEEILLLLLLGLVLLGLTYLHYIKNNIYNPLSQHKIKKLKYFWASSPLYTLADVAVDVTLTDSSTALIELRLDKLELLSVVVEAGCPINQSINKMINIGEK